MSQRGCRSNAHAKSKIINNKENWLLLDAIPNRCIIIYIVFTYYIYSSYFIVFSVEERKKCIPCLMSSQKPSQILIFINRYLYTFELVGSSRNLIVPPVLVEFLTIYHPQYFILSPHV